MLIIFVKNPVEGKVKSRLASSIGTKKAQIVYMKLLARTRDVVHTVPVDKLVCYSDEIDENDLWSEDDFQKDLQKGHDLGVRMYHAIEKASKANYDEICLIGSDNMEITPDIILEAFNSLKIKDVVIGPSKDGGYYLIGMKKPIKEIFNIRNWGTSSVLDETLSRIKKLNLNYHLLTELNDIDELEDINDKNRDYLLS